MNRPKPQQEPPIRPPQQAAPNRRPSLPTSNADWTAANSPKRGMTEWSPRQIPRPIPRARTRDSPWRRFEMSAPQRKTKGATGGCVPPIRIVRDPDPRLIAEVTFANGRVSTDWDDFLRA